MRLKHKFLHLRVAVFCDVRAGTIETVVLMEKLRSVYVKV